MDPKDHQVPEPPGLQGHQSPDVLQDQAAQSPVQPDPERPLIKSINFSPAKTDWKRRKGPFPCIVYPPGHECCCYHQGWVRGDVLEAPNCTSWLHTLLHLSPLWEGTQYFNNKSPKLGLPMRLALITDPQSFTLPSNLP